MRILVLQHDPNEHPGVFRRVMAEEGHNWHVVRLDAGEAPPPLGEFDAVIALGGPQQVWEEAKYPWLAAEKALIRAAVAERGMPFLGICLGHQLLAEALGGACRPATVPELGVLEVALAREGRVSPLTAGLPSRPRVLHWHDAEVARLPPGARLLMTAAAAPGTPVQAMGWGPHAISVQFHLEAEADTVAKWADVSGCRGLLEARLGREGAEALIRDCAAHAGAFEALARRIWRNWTAAAAGEGGDGGSEPYLHAQRR